MVGNEKHGLLSRCIHTENVDKGELSSPYAFGTGLLLLIADDGFFLRHLFNLLRTVTQAAQNLCGMLSQQWGPSAGQVGGAFKADRRAGKNHFFAAGQGLLIDIVVGECLLILPGDGSADMGL